MLIKYGWLSFHNIVFLWAGKAVRKLLSFKQIVSLWFYSSDIYGELAFLRTAKNWIAI